MWLTVHNLMTVVTRATPQERRWLDEYLAFGDTTAHWKGRRKDADGTSLLNPVLDDFPTGLLPMVRKAAKAARIEVDLGDRRFVPCDVAPIKSWLWPHQQVAFDRCLATQRGIVWIPMGGGKGEIMVALAEALRCRWLVVVPQTSLVDQLAERWQKRVGEEVGKIREGSWEERRVTVSTYQSLTAALREGGAVAERAKALLDGAEGIMGDEIHVAAAETFNGIVMKTPNAFFRYGFSGTPLDREDRRSLLAIAAIGPVVYRVETKVLVAEGLLAKARVRVIPMRHRPTASTWQGVYGECVVRSPARNRLLCSLVKRAAKPGLLFVRHINHGKLLLTRLQKEGVACEFVWGEDDVEARRAAIKRLVRGDVEVLVTSSVLQTGIDIPEVRSIVVGSGGKSLIDTLQRVGRGTRISAGKTSFEVYDIDDQGNEWLEKHAKRRVQAYCREGFEVSVEGDLFQGLAKTRKSA